MKTAQHTPGPWHVAGPCPTNAAQFNVRCMAGGLLFNTGPVWHNYTPDPAEMLANARLIAAAPDLLLALQDLANYVGGWDEPDTHPCGKARLAIAKATGGDHV